MFKVRATVVGFDKNEKKYPCHFRYKICDEIIYDGETITGRVCPSIIPKIAQMFNALYASGGRHKEGEIPACYMPIWHASFCTYDPSYKKYDGVGLRPVLERPEEGYKFIPDGILCYTPPGGKYIIGKGTERREFTSPCPDIRTMVRFKFEAFDLSDKGNGLTYFRRAMSILDKVISKPGITLSQILKEFSMEEIYNIYPVLGQNLIAALIGELELIGYVEVKDAKATITDKGVKKLENYKASLSVEEKEALKF